MRADELPVTGVLAVAGHQSGLAGECPTANRTLCLTGFLRLCDDVRPTSFSHVDPRPVVITLI